MATIDEILGGGTSRKGTSPQGTQKRTEQHSEGNATIGSPTVAKNPEEKPEQKPVVQVDHGGVEQEFGDGIHAFMKDGTIRTKGDTGYTYSNPGENVSNVDLFKVLNPHKPITQEEIEKEKKKQKRDQVIAAIGDGISALSNLFFTTKGAPNMYDGRNNMSEKTRVRYDRLMKEREGKDAAWYAGYMRAMEADREKADRDRAWQRQLGLDEDARQRYKDKAAKEDIAAKQSAELHDLLVKLKGHEIGYAEAKRKEKEIKAKYADQLTKAEVEKERSQAKYYSNGGGSGNGGKYTLFNKQTGVTEEFKTRSEWLRRAGELGYNTKPGESNSSSHDDFRGNKTTTTEKGETLEEMIGRQEAEAREKWEEENGGGKKKSPTAGDSSSKKKSPTM